jgi:hypothetical protein
MKKITGIRSTSISQKGTALFIGGILLISLVISCTKEKTDDRDKFIGSWAGTINLVVPGLSSNTSNAESLVITKGTASDNQIILTQTGSTMVPTGKVSGNTYTYDEYNVTSSYSGITITAKFNGTGTISGNAITESGTIVYNMGGIVYPGTWSSTLTKQ